MVKVQTDLVARDYTIHLAKRLKKTAFKKKAPKAIKEIKAFAQQMMKTKDVRIADSLNKAVWAKGVKNVPVRLRVRLSRKRNDDEEADEKLYTFVENIPVKDFHGLITEKVE